MSHQLFSSLKRSQIFLLPENETEQNWENAFHLTITLAQNYNCSFHLIDINQIIDHYLNWKTLLPRVRPYFAHTLQRDPKITYFLGSLGCGFSCASYREINDCVTAVPRLQSNEKIWKDVILSNPFKLNSDMKNCRLLGVKMTTFMNKSELDRIKIHWPDAELLLSVATNKKLYNYEMTISKIAAPIEKVKELLEYAKKLDLNVIGLICCHGTHFKVKKTWKDLPKIASGIVDEMTSIGFDIQIVSMGDGFDYIDHENEDGDWLKFQENLSALNNELDEYFPISRNIQLIAQPGRYFTQKAELFAFKVMGKRIRKLGGEGDCKEEEDVKEGNEEEKAVMEKIVENMDELEEETAAKEDVEESKSEIEVVTNNIDEKKEELDEETVAKEDVEESKSEIEVVTNNIDEKKEELEKLKEKMKEEEDRIDEFSKETDKQEEKMEMDKKEIEEKKQEIEAKVAEVDKRHQEIEDEQKVNEEKRVKKEEEGKKETRDKEEKKKDTGEEEEEKKDTGEEEEEKKDIGEEEDVKKEIEEKEEEKKETGEEEKKKEEDGKKEIEEEGKKESEEKTEEEGVEDEIIIKKQEEIKTLQDEISVKKEELVGTQEAVDKAELEISENKLKLEKMKEIVTKLSEEIENLQQHILEMEQENLINKEKKVSLKCEDDEVQNQKSCPKIVLETQQSLVDEIAAVVKDEVADADGEPDRSIDEDEKKHIKKARFVPDIKKEEEETSPSRWPHLKERHCVLIIENSQYMSFNYHRGRGKNMPNYWLSTDGDLRNLNLKSADGDLSATLYGNTCDSLDVICQDTVMPESVSVGDHLIWINRGCYGSCMMSQFNGIKPPKHFHFINKNKLDKFMELCGLDEVAKLDYRFMSL